MKYYKLIDDPEKVWKSFEIGRIYPETFIANGKSLTHWLYPYNASGNLMQEVSEDEYKLQEGILPEKWYIIPENEEEDKVLCKWRGGGHASHYSNAALSSSKYWQFITDVESNHTRITFEQFKKYVLNKEKMIDKKIIGYKAPFDIYGGNIKKESIVKLKPGETCQYYINSSTSEVFYIPTEIVKTWEPVYEEDKPKFKVGDWVTVISVYSNSEKGGNNNPIFYRVGVVSRIDKIYNERCCKNKDYEWIHLEGEMTDCGITDNQVRLATTKEINTYLFEEAKRRYPIGTKIYPVHLSTSKTFVSEVRSHDNYYDLLINTGYICFNNDGNEWLPVVYNKKTNTWAEIAEEALIINGYTAKFHKDNVDFGCQRLSTEFIIKLAELTKNGISIHDNKGKDLEKELAEIYKRLKQ